MANKNRGWVTTRELWRSPKYESMVGRMSPYKLLAKDVSYAAWRVFSSIRIRKEDKK